MSTQHQPRKQKKLCKSCVPLCDLIHPLGNVLPQEVVGSGKGLSHVSRLVNLTLVRRNVCLKLLVFLEETLHGGEVLPVVLRLKLVLSVINPRLEVVKGAIEEQCLKRSLC